MKYHIEGDNLPVVIIDLDINEKLITEGGAMTWRSPNLIMDTIGGSTSKVLGRMFSGESLFQNVYTAKHEPGYIAIASKFPGSIKVINITPDVPIICQKGAFLASTENIQMEMIIQKKIATGLFGGEGFIMQKISGDGLAFIEVDGYAHECTLASGEQIVISSGHLVMMEASCSMDIKSVGNAKNMFLGNEGFFNTIVTGPGKVIVQTMTCNQFLGRSVS